MYRLILTTLVLFVGCQPQMPPPAEALSDSEISQIRNEVQEAFDRLIEVSEILDGDAVVSLMSDHEDLAFASNGFLFGPKQQVIEEIIPGWGSGLQSQDIEVEQSAITVLSDDIAIQSISGNFAATLPDGTENPRQRMVGTFVWQKGENGWQLLHMHQSFAPINQAEE